MVMMSDFPRGRYDPSPLVVLSDKNTRENLSPSAIKAFFNIMQRWNIKDEDARVLLDVSRGWLYHVKKESGVVLDSDKLQRISFLIGIFKALNILYSEKLADAWITQPNNNPLFRGQSPLQFMCVGGLLAMQTVRRVLDARRGAM